MGLGTDTANRDGRLCRKNSRALEIQPVTGEEEEGMLGEGGDE